jgi:ATP-dependent Zn protease
LLNPILKLQKSLILKLLIEGYQRAIEILEENKDKLNQLADILIEKEVIFKDDLETFGKRAFDKKSRRNSILIKRPNLFILKS